MRRDRETTRRRDTSQRSALRSGNASTHGYKKSTSPARQVLKARILLKADASETGQAWSDGEIAEALDTSIDTIARTRQKLVEEGLDAALTRKHSPNSGRKRIFDGAAEAKLIALACSAPPKGRKRWTLTLLETAVV
jgi:transposase